MKVCKRLENDWEFCVFVEDDVGLVCVITTDVRHFLCFPDVRRNIRSLHVRVLFFFIIIILPKI